MTRLSPEKKIATRESDLGGFVLDAVNRESLIAASLGMDNTGYKDSWNKISDLINPENISEENSSGYPSPR